MPRLRKKILALLLSVLSPVAHSEADVQAFVDFTAMHDDNLYRLDSAIAGSSLPSGVSKSDTLFQTTAGLNADWKISRQQLLFGASVADNRFDKNDQLDYLGHSLDGTWRWKVGSRVFGVIGVASDVTLSDFSTSAILQKSERSEVKQTASINWRYHPNYQLGVFLQDYYSSYDLDVRKVSNREQVNAALNWVYLAGSGSKFGLRYQNLSGKSPNRVLDENSTIDNEFEQDELMLTVLWNASQKSQLTGEFGLVARNHPNIKERDYDGVNVSFIYGWMPTAKLRLQLEAYRKVSSSDDVLANYSENTGLDIQTVWAVTDKISAVLSVASELKDYAGLDDVSSNLPELRERYDSQSIRLGYEPNKNLNLDISYLNSNRESNRNLRDFVSKAVSLNLTINL